MRPQLGHGTDVLAATGVTLLVSLGAGLLATLPLDATTPFSTRVVVFTFTACPLVMVCVIAVRPEPATMESTLHPNPLMANPPVRRFGCVVVAFNQEGEVLMVDPEYKEGLILPGGSAEADEVPNVAAARHMLLETGLALDLWQIIAVDYVPAGEFPEGINFVFHGGILTPLQAERIKGDTPATHLRGHR